jgi:hypothetical protein
VALITETVNTHDRRLHLQRTYDDTTYDAASDSFPDHRGHGVEPDRRQRFPGTHADDLGDLQGQPRLDDGGAGQTKSQTFPGGRSIADVTDYGLS